MKPCDAFLNVAKKDLKAAQTLYARRLYPQAIFYLQQSIEKSFKAFGILYDNLTVVELKNKVGHFPLRVLSHMMQKIKETPEWQQSLDIWLHGKDKIAITPDKLDETIKVFNNVKLFDMIEMPKLRKLLNVLLKYMSGPVRRKNLSAVAPTIYNGIASYAKMTKKKYAPNMTEATSNKAMATLQKIFPYIAEAEYLLIMLSLSIPPSAIQNSRYPMYSGIPSKIYNAKHYLVKAFPKLVKFSHIMQEKLAWIFRELNRLDKMYG
ncbi:MAG TPA: HEPN domain-containing protein [bacterium]